MSRKTYEVGRIISKCTASILVLSCILLSSPGILLADDATNTNTSTDTVVQSQTDSSPLDVQTVQPAEASIDTTTLLPDTSAIATGDNNSNSGTAPTSSDSNVVQPVIDPTPTTSDLPPALETTSQSTGDVLQTNDQNSNGDPSANNTDTGSDSQNDSTTNVNNNTDITNQNYVEVFNDSFLQANTGQNNANYNTGSGIITTQKAGGNGQLINVLNKNSVQTGNGANQSPLSASNQTTGPSSNNTSQTNINNELTVKNINDANAINRITADVNSGNNSASFNTGHGILTTGEANLGLNFFSLANTNLFGAQKFYANLQNVYSDYTGNIDLSNELNTAASSPLSGLLLNASNDSTGKNSNSQSIVSVNDQTSITNQNNGKINNEIDAKVISGENKTNYNTGTGSVVSGPVNSSVNVVNFLNSNISSGKWLMKTLNVFGDWSGDLKLPSMQTPDLISTVSPSNYNAINSNTGEEANNSTNVNVSNSTNLTNDNNATIENNVTMKTDSGTNDASYNGGSGIVKIGAASAETNEMNIANMNITGNSWWLIVINRFGSWNGTAIGSPEAVAIKTTGISTVLTPQQSGVNVTNNSTGPDSNSLAGVNIDHKTDINNTNQADIVNTLNIKAISGENEARYNTGHGYIETGDIRGVNNIVNFANSNITVGNWVVVVANVFGDWTGNLVFSNGNGTLPVGGSLACPVFNSSNTGVSSSSTSNNTTGSSSQNNSNLSSSTTNSATNNNNANLNNTTSASTTTGQNNANYNTGSGNISTGQAQTGSSVTNQANTNSSTTGQGGSGTLQDSNNTTGSGSTNDSSVTSNNSTSATNNNDSTVNNNVSGSNNTGQNNSNYNTGNGSIDTSWANTFLDLRNQVNDNKITLGDLSSDFNQNPVAPGSEAQVPNDNSSTQVCPGVMIVVTPSTSSITTGGTQTFSAVANDPSGNPVSPQPTFTWTATGGTIDSNGVYNAGTTSGSFAVTATASYGNQGSANITVTSPSVNSGGGGGGGGGGGIITASSFGGGGTSKILKGDFNNDGKVDDLDFSILMAGWGQRRTGLIAAQNGDGLVGDSDLSVVMSGWTIIITIATTSPPVFIT